MVKIATFYVMRYTFTNNNISLFITGVEVKMMIDVDTFYLDETTTIQCSASEDTDLLELRTSIDGEEKATGCLYGAGVWASRDNIFSQSLITDPDCTTAAQSTPFIITLQPTVTEQLEGLNFWCVAYDSATSTLKNTSSVTVNNIKGKLIVNYLLYSKYFSRLN